MDEGGEPLATTDEATVASGVELISLKDGHAFLVADANGDVTSGAEGLFDRDTRVLSRFVFLVGERHPTRLSSTVSRDNAVFTFHGTNRAIPPVNGRGTPRGAIHVERRRALQGERLYERIRCTNFGLDQVMLPLVFEYAADFRDMFEVRGVRRARRGTQLPPQLLGRHVLFAYEGLDEIVRISTVTFSEPPWRMDAERAEFMFTLSPGERIDLFVEAGAGQGEPPSRERFRHALADARRTIRRRERRGALLRASDDAHSAWFEQSRADLGLLVSDLPSGPYPFAGIPWFSTPFGRDGLLTAWQLLWLDPTLAKGVLTYLAARQATHTSAFADSQPGKIMHETRGGEMAALNEIPFGCYYGGVDTTPLFVALAGAYLTRTDDLTHVRHLWPALLRAVAWIEGQGDSDGDGLIDYKRGAETGLANQGWKDSEDSVFHADGRLPPGPIALVEVQGYAYAAYRAMARMSARLGEPGAEHWRETAEALRERVEARFWMEDAGFYGIAIDGEGALCSPLTSNVGHLLFSGLPARDRAARVTQRLLSPSFDCGWGLRTLAEGSCRYNPMSYHNGSVWPHDTSICVAGMAAYGERTGAARVMGDLYRAARCFGLRMPELLCGFPRRAGEPPIAYPVTCMPQAWAAGSVFLMLQACLGLSIDAARGEVRVVRPTLPHGMDTLSVDHLDVAGAKVSLIFQRLDGATVVSPAHGSDRSISVVLER
ncbi:MAG TPA: glycogen debranching N-terminal domain-containing protein [Caulobacteraceae bacterium]|nr:glycogen debranching N-terminal domain-containing protein [Caulobacteraceae bacterium]